MKDSIPLRQLLEEVRACRHCEADLPLGPRPVLRAAASARLLVIGQAPGTRVHASGIPWNDPSGARLRDWMGIDADTFYDEGKVAIVPMGFCYPGRGGGGDLPPRPECAALWHARILDHLPRVRLTLLVGSHAQARYMGRKGRSLGERVRDRDAWPPGMVPLVHPSPRNQAWLKRNPWFEREVLPELRRRVHALLMEPARPAE